MEQKVKNLVYLEPDRYVSLEISKNLFKASSFFVLLIVALGVMWEIISAVIMVCSWFVLYSAFVCVLHSRRLVKTFRLRFLVNGLTSLSMTSIFMLLLYIFLYLKYPGCIWWVLAGLISFLILYTAVIVYGVHKDCFGKVKKIYRGKRFRLFSSIAGSLMLVCVVLGWLTSKFIGETASEELKSKLLIWCLILLIFLTALGFINIIQYYYCIRYDIHCDENGVNASPQLEPPTKEMKLQAKKEKTLFSRIVRIVLGIAWAIFILFFAIGIIIHL